MPPAIIDPTIIDSTASDTAAMPAPEPEFNPAAPLRIRDRPQPGWISASCLRCRSQLCFWQQYGPDIELTCIGCGWHLATAASQREAIFTVPFSLRRKPTRGAGQRNTQS